MWIFWESQLHYQNVLHLSTYYKQEEVIYSIRFFNLLKLSIIVHTLAIKYLPHSIDHDTTICKILLYYVNLRKLNRNRSWSLWLCFFFQIILEQTCIKRQRMSPLFLGLGPQSRSTPRRTFFLKQRIWALQVFKRLPLYEDILILQRTSFFL